MYTKDRPVLIFLESVSQQCTYPNLLLRCRYGLQIAFFIVIAITCVIGTVRTRKKKKNLVFLSTVYSEEAS